MAALNIIMMQQTQKDILKAVLIDIVKKLEGGDTLAVSFANYPKIFPKLFIHMVEVGELGGVLDEVLEQMAIHFEKEYELSEKIKSAMSDLVRPHDRADWEIQYIAFVAEIMK